MLKQAQKMSRGKHKCAMRKSISGLFMIRSKKNMTQDRLAIRRTGANGDNPVITSDVKCQCGSILRDQDELNMKCCRYTAAGGGGGELKQYWQPEVNIVVLDLKGLACCLPQCHRRSS